MKPTMKKTKNSLEKSDRFQKGTSKRVPATKKVGKPSTNLPEAKRPRREKAEENFTADDINRLYDEFKKDKNIDKFADAALDLINTDSKKPLKAATKTHFTNAVEKARAKGNAEYLTPEDTARARRKAGVDIVNAFFQMILSGQGLAVIGSGGSTERSRYRKWKDGQTESVQKANPAMSFREMLKLVIESGGQQKMDAKNPALLRWAQRVASNKYTEHSKQELYAGLLYERFGGEFSLYDSLNESVQRRRKLREGLNDQEIDRIRKLTADLHNRDISSQEFFKQINSMQAVPAAEEPPVPSADDVDMSMASDFDSDFGADDDIVDPEYDLGLDAELSNMDDLGDFDDLGDLDQPPPRATPIASY